MSTPLFSVLHTTARPDKWQEAYDAWIARAANPENVEYVLCVDEKWGFKPPSVQGFRTRIKGTSPGCRAWLNTLVWNEGSGAVSGWNAAARASTGGILLVAADDFFPCERWDDELLKAIMGHFDKQWLGSGPYPNAMRADFAIRVSSGVPEADNQGHICHAFMSRARYEHQGGYVYFPEYDGVFCDNDFTAHAEQDGVIIDARHLQFEHRHPGYKGGFSPDNPELDAAFWRHNKPENYKYGRKVFLKRRADRFGHGPAVAQPNEKGEQPVIGLCLSGERFEGAWFDAIFNLYDHLQSTNWRVWRMRGYESGGPHATRHELVTAMASVDPKPEYLLWLDDDNTLTPEQFDLLVQDLVLHPEVDGVIGWCWIYDKECQRFYVSCGQWSPDHRRWNPFEPVEFSQAKELRSVEAFGFPVVLMRWSAIEKAGQFPFRPVFDDSLPFGMSGEDHAFCLHAEEGGARFLVDPRVYVPHLKYVSVVPAMPKVEPKPEPKVAAMLRVKNEARWIDRVIDSLKPLCGEHIYFMDDFSDDDTVAMAEAAGAHRIDNPYRNYPLDERRDKNYITQKVRDIAAPDWILCVDGDEELEPGGAEKIRRALATGDADCYALRFLHLWNSPETIRIDRWYSSFSRLSLFRPIEGYGFQSLYEKNGNNVHAGLHTGNAPAGMKFAALNVFLIHYGYMVKEDRIRKWNWYTQNDPNNEAEDGYRHCVQGDVPEVPADAVLLHAGPLELRKLPERLVPALPRDRIHPLLTEVSV